MEKGRGQYLKSEFWTRNEMIRGVYLRIKGVGVAIVGRGLGIQGWGVGFEGRGWEF